MSAAGASRGPPLGALPNCLYGNQAPSFLSSATLSHHSPQRVAFGENQGQTGWSSGQPLLVLEVSTGTGPRPLPPHAGATRQPASQVPCHKGQNQLCGSSLDLSSPPSAQARGRTTGLQPRRCHPIPTGQPLVWMLKPWLSLGTSLNFSGPSFLPCVVSSPGPALGAPDTPGSPLGDAYSGVAGVLTDGMKFRLEQRGEGKS